MSIDFVRLVTPFYCLIYILDALENMMNKREVFFFCMRSLLFFSALFGVGNGWLLAQEQFGGQPRGIGSVVAARSKVTLRQLNRQDTEALLSWKNRQDGIFYKGRP